MNKCNICQKHFRSKSSIFIHKREKHTFYNTKEVKCPCCLKLFNSPIFNKKKNKYYDRCEDCRELSKKLSSRPLKNCTYVYGKDKERFFIDKGNIIQFCSLYNCFNRFPCSEHNIKNIIQCSHAKCNNCYIQNDFNECEICRKNNNNSKNKKRHDIKKLKEELGGKCVDCGFNELFYLEFDHIDPNNKSIQITRSSKLKWEDEKIKLELRCGRCHRLKSNIESKLKRNNDISNKYIKCRRDKYDFVNKIKILIGHCQNCNWNIKGNNNMCCALDFDHVSGLKYNQISNLRNVKKEKIVDEIKKTRLLCRHCHELYTCLSRGGKSLLFYYEEEEINKLKIKIFDKESIKNAQNEICEILDNLKL